MDIVVTTGSFKMGINNPMNYVCGGPENNGSGGPAMVVVEDNLDHHQELL